MIDVSIIIVNWNTRQLLRNCLNSIISQTTECIYDIWVVDNNSPDKSAEMVSAEFPFVNLIANTDNKGFAAANNQALRSAKARYYLLLNPDTIIIDKAIDRMIQKADVHHIHAATCTLLNPDFTYQESVGQFFSLTGSLLNNRLVMKVKEKLQIPASPQDVTSGLSQKQIDWAHGAVLLFTDTLLNKTGLLDEQFFIYGEEIDFYLRLRKSGFKAYFFSNISIVHFGKASSNQKRAEMFIQNYKSFYLLLKKHYPAYVYPLYRLRVYFYFPVWILFHSFMSISNKKNSAALTQLRVYLETFVWHFSKNSFIKIAD